MLGPMIPIAGTLIVGFFSQWLLMKKANTIRMVCEPGSRRRHERPTALTGGIGIAIALAAGLGLHAMSSPRAFEGFALIFTGALILHLFGLMDDLRGISARTKLFGQFIALGLAIASPRLQEFMGGWYGQIGWAIYPLTALWIIGVINAINLMDGLDGLAAAIVLTILIPLATSGWYSTGRFYGGFMLIVTLAAAIIPFFSLNLNPAKVFMGDNGSLVLGYFVGVLTLTEAQGKHPWTETVSIILMCGLPILDMGWVTFKRMKLKVSPMRADRNHIHYRLLNLRLSVNETVAVLAAVTLCYQALAHVIRKAELHPLALVSTLAAVALSFAFLKMMSRFGQVKSELGKIVPIHVSRLRVDTTAPHLAIDLSPMFSDIEGLQWSSAQHALEGLVSILALKLPADQGYRIEVSGQSMLVYSTWAQADPFSARKEVSKYIEEWFAFIDYPLPALTLPIRIVAAKDSELISEQKVS